MIRKVLIPIDGSEHAIRAVEYAVGLAKEISSLAVHLVIVHITPSALEEVHAYKMEQRAAQLAPQHSEKLLKPALAKLAAAKVPVTTEVRTGPTAQQICRAATDHGCDTIIMCTRGMGAIANLLMGSVATKVVHLSTVPVLLVK